MATDNESPPMRRSGRARRKATTYYDEAAKAVELQLKKKEKEVEVEEASDMEEDIVSLKETGNKTETMKKRKSKRTTKDDDNDQEQEQEEDSKSEEEYDGEESRRAEAIKRKRSPAKKTTKTKNGTSSSKSVKRVSTAHFKSTSTSEGGSAATKARKISKARITTALTMLSKKVLDKKVEKPTTSLIAALLASVKPIPKIPSTSQLTVTQCQYPSHVKHSDGEVAAKIVSLTKTLALPQIDGVARHLVRNFQSNAMHIQLLNLLFRSVGGTIETNIDDAMDLEELEDDQWDDIMSKVVEVMRDETDADQVLLSADYPPPMPHDQQQKIGLIAYRTIFKEFWYRLGHVLLNHVSSSSSNTHSLVDDGEDNDQDTDKDSIQSFGFDDEKQDDESSSKKTTQEIKPADRNEKKAENTTVQQNFSSNRFQLEMMRDLISRVTEFVTVGQPDLRSSGTLAIFQLGKACLERTIQLETKIQIATRQHKSAKQSQSKSKMNQLKNNIDAWLRHKAELEEIVTGQVIQAAFINRYRDTNATVRKESLDALSEFSLIRPDVFFVDTYLKYFGWMTHDKDARVRASALNALLAPFKIFEIQTQNSSSSKRKKTSPYEINIAAMQHVTVKFLSRFVDCAHDAEDVRVQEVAMKLLLAMVRVDFLDDCDEDSIWESVNMKCLDIHSSSQLRRDALYFVLEQLDSFDTHDDHLSEKKMLERIASLAKWVATALIDGPIPVDKVHLQLVDCVVQSLLEMPEHRELVLNWRVLIQAIRSVVDRKGTTEKLELTIQRVLLRILVTSAERAHEHAALVFASGKVTNKASSSEDIDGLSSTLLQSIPTLLTPFKSDVVGMRQISKLPLLISPAVLSLSARKADFQTVLKSLCQLYLESNDNETLQNVALMLSKWVDGDHTRVADVKFQLKQLSEGLLKRLMDLFRETDPGSAKPQRASPRRSKHGKGERTCSSSVDMFSVSSDLEVEQAIVLQMHRLKMLLTACNANHLFEDSANDQKETKVDGLFSMISEAIAQRLKDRKPSSEGDKGNESGSVSVPSIWRDEDPDLHIEVAKNVDVSLRVLLLIVSHELSDVLEARNDVDITSYREADMEMDRLPVVRHRNHLATLLIMCFDQFIEHNDACTDDELSFSEKVQISAGQVSSDLRSLFPCELSEAVDPVRRALSMQEVPNHMLLVGGFARWLQNASLHDVAENESLVVSQTTAPLCKSIAANTIDFFRREMALALTHIHGKGQFSSQLVTSLIRLVRRENPIRLLESHMACLRMAFEHWLNSEPEEPELSCPTEEQLAAFDEEEKRHLKLFSDLQHLAGKLSPTLGVVRLKEDIRRSFHSFMKEGIRYAFEEDEVYTLGTRLPFLQILIKYSSWLKKEIDELEDITVFILSKEAELKAHSDFNDIHEDDLGALASFKGSLGIKRSAESSYYDEESTIATRTTMATPSPCSSHRRGSSTVGSRRSVQSNVSNLSPLEEGDSREEEEIESSLSPRKKQKRQPSPNSLQSALSNAVVEEQESDEDDETDMSS